MTSKLKKSIFIEFKVLERTNIHNVVKDKKRLKFKFLCEKSKWSPARASSAFQIPRMKAFHLQNAKGKWEF